MNDGMLVIPDVVVDRMRRYFKPEAVSRLLDSPAALFDGRSPVEFVRSGQSWEEVLFRYDKLFSYGVTA